jgi:hypothetical protein
VIDFNRDHYDYECAKCGQTAPRLVEHYRRDPRWGDTAASMAAWRAAYARKFGCYHELPTTGLSEWLIVVCRCGYAFEMRTADA